MTNKRNGSDIRVLAYFTVRATQSRFSFKLNDTQPFNTSKTPGDRSHMFHIADSVLYERVWLWCCAASVCESSTRSWNAREKENEQLHTTDAKEILCSAVWT